MKKFIYCAILSCCSFWTNSFGQANEYSFKAIFVYNFTKYVEWPATHQSGDFMIGVVGNSPMYEQLTKLFVGKKVGNQPIIVKKFTSAARLEPCQMLYVSEEINFAPVLSQTKGKPILVVTEKTGLAQQGSNINFVLVEQRWRFQINEGAIQSAGLKVSNELTKLATPI